MRNVFGEFFRRTVVLSLLPGRKSSETVINLAFLLEVSEYNAVDIDTVWRTQVKDHGKIGNYELKDDSFAIYGEHLKLVDKICFFTLDFEYFSRYF